jgi:hypothetical protein
MRQALLYCKSLGEKLKLLACPSATTTTAGRERERESEGERTPPLHWSLNYAWEPE